MLLAEGRAVLKKREPVYSFLIIRRGMRRLIEESRRCDWCEYGRIPEKYQCDTESKQRDEKHGQIEPDWHTDKRLICREVVDGAE